MIIFPGFTAPETLKPPPKTLREAFPFRFCCSKHFPREEGVWDKRMLSSDAFEFNDGYYGVFGLGIAKRIPDDLNYVR